MDKPLSRYVTTEYNRCERLLGQLTEVYASARIYHLTHAQILASLAARIYTTRDWKKLRPYHRGLFDGMRRALMDELWRAHLEWRVYFDGALVRSADVPEGRWSDVCGGEHVWASAPDKLFAPSPSVRLVLYDSSDKAIKSTPIHGHSLLDAAEDAVMRGMASGLNFHVMEAEGAPLRMYWHGRKVEQPMTRNVVRRILAEAIDARKEG